MSTPTLATIAFATILVPSDFTDASKKALDYAKAISRRYNSEIILTHVSAPINPILAPEGEWFDEDSVPPQIMNEQLEEISAELRSEGFRSRAVSLTGSVECEILSLAEREHVDLIVVGTHGKKAWERFISGSDAEGLYRESSRPILVIGPLANPIAIEHWHPRGIMCAITLNPNESSLASFAYTLAEKYDATFTLVHLVHPAVEGPEEKLLHFQQAMRLILPNMKVPYYVLKTLSSLDSLGPIIVELAKERSSDLIVMGANPATFMSTHFRHGISSRVIHEAPCPVLILHH